MFYECCLKDLCRINQFKKKRDLFLCSARSLLMAGHGSRCCQLSRGAGEARVYPGNCFYWVFDAPWGRAEPRCWNPLGEMFPWAGQGWLLEVDGPCPLRHLEVKKYFKIHPESICVPRGCPGWAWSLLDVFHSPGGSFGSGFCPQHLQGLQPLHSLGLSHSHSTRAALKCH